MALPKAYLTSIKNLGSVFDAIRQAKAPERFSQRFLESLEFKSSSDRLVIGVLKALGFLDDQGKPLARYFEFLDQTQSERVMADAIREAYDDLFQVNRAAEKLTKQEIMNKFKTLSQGQFSESVIDKMAMTFTGLVKFADFTKPTPKQSSKIEEEPIQDEQLPEEIFQDDPPPRGRIRDSMAQGASKSLGGLHYNIQIILPDSRDPAVYDALFRSLKEHIL